MKIFLGLARMPKQDLLHLGVGDVYCGLRLQLIHARAHLRVSGAEKIAPA
jgi:hypothetical protein